MITTHAITVDTNIIFSALLKNHSNYYDVLTNNSIHFLIPKFAFIELFKHKEKIVRYSEHADDEVLEILYGIMKNIQIYDENLISLNSREKAWNLVKEIDEKDTVFVALCLETNSRLWTGDKKLINGLRNKGFDRFFEI